MSFTAYFYFDGGPEEGHEIVRYKHGFIQGVDAVGRPNTPVFSSMTGLRLLGINDRELNSWMLDPYARRNARVVFKRIDQDSTLKETHFEDAYCVFLQATLDTRGLTPDPSSTIDIYLTPKRVIVNGVSHNGVWGEDES